MAVSTPVLPKLVGERVKRREDPRLIQGRATYVDDIKIAGMRHMAFTLGLRRGHWREQVRNMLRGMDPNESPTFLLDPIAARLFQDIGGLQTKKELIDWVCENARSTRAFLKRVDAVVPLAMPLRFANFLYFFVLLMQMAFSFRPRLLLWTTLCGVGAWTAGFLAILWAPGIVTDPPSADVTAHVVELLAREQGYEENVRRGIDYLLAEQEEDGSWFGRWGVNHVYGTGAVLPALQAAGFPSDHPAIVRAVAWLEAHQNADGGFGEDCRSYDHGEAGLEWRGRGESTPSQTAWALLALLAAGERGAPTQRAVAWLAGAQRADGDWDEPHFTGTGFPGDFYIRYHLYRLSFPLMALGRFVASEPARS